MTCFGIYILEYLTKKICAKTENMRKYAGKYAEICGNRFVTEYITKNMRKNWKYAEKYAEICGNMRDLGKMGNMR